MSAVSKEKDEYLNNGPSGLHRSASGEGSRIRGPRAAARGPRAAPGGGGGGVGSIISRLNQGDAATSPTGTGARGERERPQSIIAANPADYAPKGRRGGRMQAGVFSKNLNTRSMASGSEDETVGKHD